MQLLRSNLRNALVLVTALILAVTNPAVSSWAIESPGEKLDQIGIFSELGRKVDLSAAFVTSDGAATTLGDLIEPSGLPTIIVPVYYKCPRLCGLLMGGFIDLLKGLTLSLGRDFNVVVYSIASSETSEDAREAKAQYADLANLTEEQRLRFHFLVGDQSSIDTISRDIGFRYLPDGVDFAHSAGLILLTPSGVVSQYFTGIEFHPFDVRLALVEASEGKIGTALDHVMLYCFRFDPLKGKYTWVMTGALRIGGVVTILLLGGLIVALVYRERRQRLAVRASQ